MKSFSQDIENLKSLQRYRTLNLPQGLDLTSNDYLGMANHPALREIAIDALENGLSLGSTGSRLLRGHTIAHKELEEFAASYFLAPRALYFSSGFQANFSLITTLINRHDVILYDSLVHASAREGIAASKARSIKIPHRNLNALENALLGSLTCTGRIWIILESLYSMDGDFENLAEIFLLGKRYGAMFMIDEAHATGVYGERGRGLCWPYILENGYENLIVLHTCGKAVGVAGGLVCAESDIIDFLINKARSFIYSTAPLPLQALLVHKSLEILDGEEGTTRRKKLFKLCQLAKGIIGGSGSQIIPIILGSDASAVSCAQQLQKEGYDVRAIRPPTVPEGQARLRISLGSDLEILECEKFSRRLLEILDKAPA